MIFSKRKWNGAQYYYDGRKRTRKNTICYWVIQIAELQVRGGLILSLSLSILSKSILTGEDRFLICIFKSCFFFFVNCNWLEDKKKSLLKVVVGECYLRVYILGVFEKKKYAKDVLSMESRSCVYEPDVDFFYFYLNVAHNKWCGEFLLARTATVLSVNLAREFMISRGIHIRRCTFETINATKCLPQQCTYTMSPFVFMFHFKLLKTTGDVNLKSFFVSRWNYFFQCHFVYYSFNPCPLDGKRKAERERLISLGL